MRVTAPIVIDAGRTQEDPLEQLRGGGGPIREDVEEVMRLLHASGSPQIKNKVLLPVVVVYSRPRKRGDQSGRLIASSDELL